mmetsp:Transcript_3382/g.11315  ORF Transcript_3382/g.11315 Transcript_3382/m.11315 type:complete len:220 (-) Transcript_3382:133-792(-)
MRSLLLEAGGDLRHRVGDAPCRLFDTKVKLLKLGAHLGRGSRQRVARGSARGISFFLPDSHRAHCLFVCGSALLESHACRRRRISQDGSIGRSECGNSVQRLCFYPSRSLTGGGRQSAEGNIQLPVGQQRLLPESGFCLCHSPFDSGLLRLAAQLLLAERAKQTAYGCAHILPLFKQGCPELSGQARFYRRKILPHLLLPGAHTQLAIGDLRLTGGEGR